MLEGIELRKQIRTIVICPAGTIEACSSRIRAYAVASGLRQQGVEARIGSPDEVGEGGILIVQKRVDENLLMEITAAIARGAHLIYDIDDSGPSLNLWSEDQHVSAIGTLASFVTTDTHSRASYLQNQFGWSHVEVIPDCVDYAPRAPMKLSQQDSDSPFRVMWFGNESNLRFADKYAKVISNCRDVEFVISCSRSSSSMEISSDSPVKRMPWQLGSFTRDLRSCHLSCLMHDGSDFDKLKSNNRMITSIIWGVPAIVSQTPEYERTATKARIPEALFRSADDLPRVLDKLRSAPMRREYLSKSQLRIWTDYSPRNVTMAWLRALEIRLERTVKRM